MSENAITARPRFAQTPGVESTSTGGEKPPAAEDRYDEHVDLEHTSGTETQETFDWRAHCETVQGDEDLREHLGGHAILEADGKMKLAAVHWFDDPSRKNPDFKWAVLQQATLMEAMVLCLQSVQEARNDVVARKGELQQALNELNSHLDSSDEIRLKLKSEVLKMQGALQRAEETLKKEQEELLDATAAVKEGQETARKILTGKIAPHTFAKLKEPARRFRCVSGPFACAFGTLAPTLVFASSWFAYGQPDYLTSAGVLVWGVCFGSLLDTILACGLPTLPGLRFPPH